ncbi:MAG TPA: hypothetical protein VF899_15430 [Pyrinomonadaceae bacterium]
MTPEARLDRLERIAKLFVRAGFRARRELRDHDKKISHLVDLQIRNEEKFGDQYARIGELIGLQRENENRFAQNENRFVKLIKSQADTDRRLEALINIVRRDHNGEED